MQDRNPIDIEMREAQIFNEIAAKVHDNAVNHGFWSVDYNCGEKYALMHSELSEGLEANRIGNPPCEKPIPISAEEEELADVVIRVMDYARRRGFDLGRAIMLKHQYNMGRPFKHGKKY